ncbi:MAG: sporulation protein YunB [Candidatus Limivicinus sp.]|jgi:sporulation protein YunB
MYLRRLFKRRLHYSYSSGGPDSGLSARKYSSKLIVLTVIGVLFLFLLSASIFLKDISSKIAVSNACDIVTVNVNNAIADIMNNGQYTADYFVDFQKDDNGEVTAISCNMARINALSAQILEKVVGSTEKNIITVHIPVGNLTGLSLLMGRGPKIPVKIIVMTSSKVEFNNSVVTAGINQTKHQITLNVIVDVSIIVPWGSESAQVTSEVLIADTVIVGKVPETYLNIQ